MNVMHNDLHVVDANYLAALDILPGYALLRRGESFVFLNAAVRAVLGLESGIDPGQPVPVDAVLLGLQPGSAAQANAPSASQERLFECVLLATDGRPRNLSAVSRTVLHAGMPAELILAVERCAGLYDELRGHTTFLEELLDSAPEALAIVHRGKILHVNHEFTRLFGYPLRECVGQDLDYLVMPDGRRHESEMLLHAVNENERALMETVRRTKQGELVDVSVLMAPVRIAGDEVGHFVSYRDIRHQKRLEAELQHTALHDALTGLANRVLFLDRLQQTMVRLQRRPDRNFAIMFLDLDRFKQVNDTLGHASGDALLLKITTRLQACLRPQDTIARFGGDEFAILLDEVQSVSSAVRIADRIQHDVRQPVDVYGHEVLVSVSIGIVMGSLEYGSGEQILRDADFAMYRAKANGKARYEIFDNSMHIRVTAQRQKEEQLREAMEQHQFEVWYQPVYRISGGEIDSFEALLRWRHPQRGIVPTSEFVGLVEDTGMIMAIGQMVLEQACIQAEKWSRLWPERGLSVSVNLSPREFAQPNLVETVAAALTASNLAPSLLRLEITETSVSLDADAAVVHLQRLSDIGVGVSLDNFGAGLASMNNLLRLPIQLLKLDRRLTAYMPARGTQGALIETIFKLGHSLHMRMQADGVETAEQLQELKRFGCELAQGHYFAGAMTAEDADKLLSKK